MKNKIFQGATIEHTGFVVPNLDEAVDFFTNILDFEVVMRRERMKKEDGYLKSFFGVNEKTIMEGAVFLEYGGKKIELVQWTDADQQHKYPSPVDIGAAHLAITVTDIHAAVKYFNEQPNVEVKEISPFGFFYITTPWGMQIQIMPQ